LEEVNLATIKDMREIFGVRVGISDHTMGSLVSIAAVALGACVVEKHFCLDRKIPTADSTFSMEPAEFKEMAENVQNAAKSLGKVFYGVKEQEKDSVIFRRSIFAVKDIALGENFSVENIRVIRPGQGLKPKHYPSLLGKKSSRDYKRGEPIEEI
jgi:pseudaminic acid synthase